MFFILSKALLFVLSPYTWLVTCVLIAFFSKKERLKKNAKHATIFILLFFSNTVLFSEVCRLWEIPGAKIEDTRSANIGIVLTGMAEFDNTLNRLSIRRGGDRIWQALNLYHAGKIKQILITGDTGYVSDRGLHEAQQMKDNLLLWGIPEKDIIIENKSVNTHGNAKETAKILRELGLENDSHLLITSGIHMKRSLACFAHEKIKCTPFSTDLYTGQKHTYFWDQYLVPNMSNFDSWKSLMKEMVGYTSYWIAGYL